MSATYQLESAWTLQCTMKTFLQHSHYTTTLQNVAQTARWYLDLLPGELEQGLQRQSPMYQDTFYQSLVRLRLPCDNVIETVLEKADPGSPNRTLTPTFLENLQCLSILPLGRSTNITKIICRVLPFCPNLIFLASPLQFTDDAINKLCQALATCRHLNTLKIKRYNVTSSKVIERLLDLLVTILRRGPPSLKNLEVPDDIPKYDQQLWVREAWRLHIHVGEVEDPFKPIKYPTLLKSL
ncbi:hypothetical protein HDU76_001934 [Blyttiomyces sp. JEL0837]|nr:hypothetical protein HDU76_001934 [Blyttiomyces sp. JEL0837]